MKLEIDGAAHAPFEADIQSLEGRVAGDRYRIVAPIVEGGMGVIYLAEHVLLERHVAVKTLPHGRFRDRRACERFHDEAEIAAGVQHPHVVQVLDYGCMDDGVPYLVMEMLEGETLASRLAREGLPTWPETSRLIAQIASGLVAVHEAGVVHRDLKPANVFLLEAAGQLPFVKLIDFGVSWRRSFGRRGARPHALVGTPLYMAPEQARGDRDVDGRADQYALAVIAFELLTGMRPFEADNLADLVDAIIRRPPPSLGTIDPTIPPCADAVMRRALSKDPSKRFSSALHFARALGTALHEAPPSVPPTQSDVRMRRIVRSYDDTITAGATSSSASTVKIR